MVDKLQIEIGLDGAAQVESQLSRLQQAFANAGAAAGRFTETMAAVAATAAVVAGSALVKFASAAADVEKSLTQLQRVTGQSFENLSALQQAFSAGGTDAKSFANALGKVAEKVQDVAQQTKVQELVKQFGAERAKEFVDWANDVEALSQQYQFLGQVVIGVGTRMTNGLTSVDTMTKAVLNSLAKVSDPEQRWARLADILKSMSEIDAARVGAKLGLSPEQINTLRQGSEALRQLQEEAKRLGLTLTATDQEALQGMTAAWNQFGALISAAFNKIGAAAAPAFMQLLTAAKTVLASIVQDFQNMPLEDAMANVFSRLAPIFEQISKTLSPIMVQAGQAIGEALVQGITSALANAGNEIMNNLMADIMRNLEILKENIRRLLSKIGIGSGGGGGENSGMPMAAGGLIGGRGTGTSDSNLAWLSRGEYVTPARAVSQPGVLSFLEALRRSGGNLRAVLNDMGHFARGGLVLPVPAYAGGGRNTGGSSSRTLHLTIGSETFRNLSVPESTALSLERFAVHSQIASTGRKPSWRR